MRHRFLSTPYFKYKVKFLLQHYFCFHGGGGLLGVDEKSFFTAKKLGEPRLPPAGAARAGADATNLCD